jgi:2-methylisocitrate lyase-like PEP mutase family enzyme
MAAFPKYRFLALRGARRISLALSKGWPVKKTTRLRQLIERNEIVVLPGAHDALCALLVERAGFEAVTAGGYSASASLLAQPDTSQLSLSEMADFYARLCDATSLPLLADADTGFGNATHVVRTVKLLERAGVAGLFIEDQLFPKRCGHMEGKAVIPREEYLAKICAAADTRSDSDLVIMARTDALAVDGLEEAIERLNLAADAGADLLFIDALESTEQMRAFTAAAKKPCLANVVEGGKTPDLTAKQFEELGFAVVAFPVAATYAVAWAVERLYAALRETGTTAPYRSTMKIFTQFNELVGLPQVRSRENEFAGAVDQLLQRAGRRSA